MFTIGYASKHVDSYIDQLRQHGVTIIADIRSVPYSKVFTDYHRETLLRHLKRAGLGYVYLGDELGPRSKSPEHYDAIHQVQFSRLMASDLYFSGVQRLRNGIDKGFKIALTCACKDPAICHRSLLVGWSLRHRHNLELRHILHDGGLESQEELEHRLLMVTETTADILTGEEGATQLAWERQCRDFAYRKPT